LARLPSMVVGSRPDSLLLATALLQPPQARGGCISSFVLPSSDCWTQLLIECDCHWAQSHPPPCWTAWQSRVGSQGSSAIDSTSLQDGSESSKWCRGPGLPASPILTPVAGCWQGVAEPSGATRQTTKALSRSIRERRAGPMRLPFTRMGGLVVGPLGSAFVEPGNDSAQFLALGLASFGVLGLTLPARGTLLTLIGD
jgi:hypothetical protein